MNQAFGFNSVHGRMPSVATGAMLANKTMMAIGVSGDGDTGAIGIGQFVHLMRRNLPIIYIIEDNGCYGLTKGQFSPTADFGSKAKNGVVNDLPPIDICALAIELGASFVARSFSGDKKQLLSVLKTAIAHRGTSMIDVISPCVTFNDHEGSTKSYAYVKDHDEPLGEISFVPFFEDISVEYEAGLDDVGEDARRLAPHAAQGRRGLQPTDKLSAMRVLHETARRGEFATGVLYIEPDKDDFIETLNLVDEPLAFLPSERVRPPQARARRNHGEPRGSDMSERTFAIIKPDAVQARTAGQILARIEGAGFTCGRCGWRTSARRKPKGFTRFIARGRSSAA